MIAYLNGVIQTKTENFLIITTNNVGYLVFVSTDVLHKYNENQTGIFFIYTIVREQEISLYGFETFAERQFFELLISVSGIGPKSALEFLNLPIETVQRAISSGDIAFLSKVKGVGKKTAERIVVELKNKLGAIISDNIIISKNNDSNNQEAVSDVILALENLGYDRINVIKKLNQAPQFDSTEDAVRWFLQNN